ncbi:MAG: 3-dehydroquinate synthase family protein [Planctomycetota bacterium]|nr:3-dehydroquinate synthase family protein [Planctomycetota bacterium]
MRLPARSGMVPVVVGRGVAAGKLAGLPRWASGVLVADRAVAQAHGAVLDALSGALVQTPAEALLLDAGEQTKDATNLVPLWTQLDRRGLDRGGVIVVAGGGSVLDVGAFLAATWLRGVDLVVVPTTLLAQVDAGLGGKCGVNLGHAKNQVGAIWQPRVIVADVDLLRGLPAAEVASGMGEVVKTALLSGPDLVERVGRLDGSDVLGDPGLDAVVGDCLRYKASVVEEDERESGRRAVLNLGHTVAHVIESLALEAGTPLPHGVAVAIGIRAETDAFCGDASCREDVARLMAHAGLQSTAEVPFSADRARALLLRDKKRRGSGIQIPVLHGIGDVRLEEKAADALLDACRAALS